MVCPDFKTENPVSQPTTQIQAKWDCWSPSHTTVLSKDNGSQKTVSVLGKGICLQNFSLYNTKTAWLSHGNTHPIWILAEQKCMSAFTTCVPFALTSGAEPDCCPQRVKPQSGPVESFKALLFEKRLADRSVVSCCLLVNNSQHLKIIRALWSALWLWFPSIYKRCEITLNLLKLMCNF